MILEAFVVKRSSWTFPSSLIFVLRIFVAFFVRVPSSWLVDGAEHAFGRFFFICMEAVFVPSRIFITLELCDKLFKAVISSGFISSNPFWSRDGACGLSHSFGTGDASYQPFERDLVLKVSIDQFSCSFLSIHNSNCVRKQGSEWEMYIDFLERQLEWLLKLVRMRSERNECRREDGREQYLISAKSNLLSMALWSALY